MNQENTTEIAAFETEMSVRTTEHEDIMDRYNKAKKLGSAVFYFRRSLLAFEERLEHLRLNCYNPQIWAQDPPMPEQFKDNYLLANKILNDIITLMQRVVRADEILKPDGAEVTIREVRDMIMMGLYRQSKIHKKVTREMPLTLLTPGTKISYYIDSEDQGTQIIRRIVANGERSFVVEVEQMEVRSYREDPSPKAFHTRFITGIVEHKPGKLDIEGYGNHGRPPFTRDIPKKRYNAKVKLNKAKTREDYESWMFSYPDSWSSVLRDDGSYTPRRSKHYVMMGSVSIIGHLIEKISGHWDDNGVDAQNLLTYLAIQGVLKYEEPNPSNQYADTVYTANRKRLTKAVRQNINRFRTPLKTRLKEEAKEKEAMWADMYDD